MIDVFIGTKAQYIKTAPLLRLITERGLSYRLIDSGQHAAFATALREELGVKEPDVVLASGADIKSVFAAAVWALKILCQTIFRPAYLKNEVFSPGRGWCVIHGDTPTTLLSMLMAKRAGKSVLHLEAGLRSWNMMRPFPEELIRIICMRYSDALFAPSDFALENLRRMRPKGEIIDMGQNTNVEALYYSLANAALPVDDNPPFCVVTVHRVETILSRKRLEFVLETIEEIAADRRIVFVMHGPTEKKLHDFGLMARLNAIEGLERLDLVPHDQFLALLENAEFVLTDGGSIQEETHYLDVPCLLLRSETERNEGLDQNVKMCNFDRETITRFLENYDSLRQGRRVENLHPSRNVLDFLLEAENRAKTEV